MRIFLCILLLRLAVFLFSPLVNLIQVIISNNQDDNDHNDLLIIILEMCNAHKMGLPVLDHSKKTIPHDLFYIATISSGLNKIYIPNTNIKELHEN